MIKYILTFMLVIVSLKADVKFLVKCGYNNVTCKKILTGLCIDPDIKSVRGWRRVCNNDKLVLYTCDGDKVRDKVIMNKACNCLEYENKDATIFPFYLKEQK